MRVTRAEAEKNRERIIETAARLFRERGFDGIGVAELMKVVGLTHGGFYGHCSSKEDLMAQACEHAMQRSLDALPQAAEPEESRAKQSHGDTAQASRHDADDTLLPVDVMDGQDVVLVEHDLSPCFRPCSRASASGLSTTPRK